MSPYTAYLLETLATLLGVCAVAFVLLLLARRLGAGRGSGGLELLGRLPLDARRSIVLVKVGEVVFVLGLGDGAMAKLGELPLSAVPRDAPTASPAFASVLAKALGRDVSATPKAPPADGDEAPEP